MSSAITSIGMAGAMAIGVRPGLGDPPPDGSGIDAQPGGRLADMGRRESVSSMKPNENRGRHSATFPVNVPAGLLAHSSPPEPGSGRQTVPIRPFTARDPGLLS